MRRDIQEIFRATPHEKQVMMFSATLSKEIRPVCRKFCQAVRTPSHSETYPQAYMYAMATCGVVAKQTGICMP